MFAGLRRGPLGERPFRLLFLGRTTSFIGSAFANVALAFAVLELTGSKADLGYVLAARALPQVVFLLVGGIWADRLPRHRVIVGSNLVSGLSQAAIAALLLLGHAQIWQLIALGAVNGLSSAFFSRLRSASSRKRFPGRCCRARMLCFASAPTPAGLAGRRLAG